MSQPSCYLYLSPKLKKWYGDLINSMNWYTYFNVHATGTLRSKLRNDIAYLYSEDCKLGSKLSRSALYEHLITRLDCFDQYCFLQGYTLGGIFYPCLSGHDKSREISDLKLPLETRHKDSLRLHSIFTTDSHQIISGEVAIEQGLALEKPDQVYGKN